MKKAYSVQGNDAGCVIFANTNVVARRLGASELDCEFNEVESCRRAPEFDHYAETEIVPIKAKIEAGWWQECQHCSQSVTADAPDIHYEGNDVVFCSTHCRHANAAEHLLEARINQAAIDCACEKWPGITPVHVSGFRLDARYVTFKFPGAQYTAGWTIGDAYLDVAVADQLVWAAFTGQSIENAKRCGE